MPDEIVNKVAASGLVTIDLEDFYPGKEVASFDLMPLLFRGLILKEKEFREGLQQTDWNQYRDKILAVHCSTDAIIPAWAYMLIATHTQGIAKEILIGNEAGVIKEVMLRRIDHLPAEEYEGKRIVVKGCGDLPVGDAAYLEITKKLLPVARSIMYGEACSNVPIFKRK
ncbi:MAG TPA: DUF2480 family protein [Puia sp.]|nr:DUF2480 family protein [Puia sp.]